MRISDWSSDVCSSDLYLGRDSVQPFLDRADKGVVILCHTSNPGAGDFQDLDVGGRPLYQRVAERVARDWNGHGNCALVVGATWPEQLREVRAIVGDMPLLIPGVGAQGGDVAARSEEHTSELQSLMRISYAVFCLK